MASKTVSAAAAATTTTHSSGTISLPQVGISPTPSSSFLSDYVDNNKTKDNNNLPGPPAERPTSPPPPPSPAPPRKKRKPFPLEIPDSPSRSSIPPLFDHRDGGHYYYYRYRNNDNHPCNCNECRLEGHPDRPLFVPPPPPPSPPAPAPLPTIPLPPLPPLPPPVVRSSFTSPPSREEEERQQPTLPIFTDSILSVQSPPQSSSNTDRHLFLHRPKCLVSRYVQTDESGETARRGPIDTRMDPTRISRPQKYKTKTTTTTTEKTTVYNYYYNDEELYYPYYSNQAAAVRQNSGNNNNDSCQQNDSVLDLSKKTT